MATLCTIAAIVAAALLLPLLVLRRVTESEAQLIRRLSGYGLSQRRIAAQLQCSRYRVRLALA